MVKITYYKRPKLKKEAFFEQYFLDTAVLNNENQFSRSKLHETKQYVPIDGFIFHFNDTSMRQQFKLPTG